jgi:hypothetical protein
MQQPLPAVPHISGQFGARRHLPDGRSVRPCPLWTSGSYALLAGTARV